MVKIWTVVGVLICAGIFYWYEYLSEVEDGYCTSSKVEMYSKRKNMVERCEKAMLDCERKRGCVIQAIVKKS